VDVDLVSIAIRTLGFVATLQAAGIAVFSACFSAHLNVSATPIRRLGLGAALIGLVLVLAHQSLEAARMAGDFGGLWSADLQMRAMQSSIGAANSTRVAALLVIATSLTRKGAPWRLLGVCGAMLLVFAFLLTGHTSTHPLRWLLAPLLLIHVSIVAFWFGALPCLMLAGRREERTATVHLYSRFTAAATWLVPLIAFAGLLMAFIFIPNAGVLHEPYGELLIVKLGMFVALMLLAALNKWRWSPAIATGGTRVAITLRRSMALECTLIVCVLAVTAALTGLYSPEP
jgi:putative copper resistance protein D